MNNQQLHPTEQNQSSLIQSIIRFRQVDKTLYRGGKPNYNQLMSLKEIGINTIIDFTTGYGKNENTPTENEMAIKLGINHINLPFPSFENPSPEYLDRFFKTVTYARQNNEKIFIHCSHGKDRTGLFAAMYKLVYGLDTLDNCISEMLAIGHDNIENPNLIPFLKAFDKEQKSDFQMHIKPIENHKSVSQFINEFLNEKNIVQSAKLLIQYYPELKWLTEDVNATPEGICPQHTQSVSEQLYGVNHIELERTLVGIECLKYVINNDCESFTKCQNENIRLTDKNFTELRNYTLNILQTPEDIDAMIAYTVINDLGKIKSFTQKIEQLTGQKTKDHDEALFLAIKTVPEQIPSYFRLSETNRQDILNGLSADFNLAQFVQGECLPANLSKFSQMSARGKNLYLIHTFYDVAGAAGHVNPNGSLVMSNPVYTGYMIAINTLNELNNGKDEITVYNLFLKQKADILKIPLRTATNQALVRLAVMSRASSIQDITVITTAFNRLKADEQNNLITGLLKDGITEGGVLLYYAPAFIQNAMNTMPDKKTEMLEKAFRIISFIYRDIHNKSGIKIFSMAQIATLIKEQPVLSATKLYETACQANHSHQRVN